MQTVCCPKAGMHTLTLHLERKKKDMTKFFSPLLFFLTINVSFQGYFTSKKAKDGVVM